jgi:hypothetical protein
MAAGEGLIYPNLSGLGKGTDWQEEVINDAALINVTHISGCAIFC